MKSLTTAVLCLFALFVPVGNILADNPSEIKLESALDDAKFVLSENQGKKVVLHFLLKTECPICLRYTAEYTKLAAKNPDTVHVFIKPDSVQEIKSWFSHLNKKDLESIPKIFRDPNAKLAKSFGIPDGYQFHGQSVHFPALVALDGQGKELFRYVGKSNSDRMSVDAFKAKIDSLKK